MKANHIVTTLVSLQRTYMKSYAKYMDSTEQMEKKFLDKI